MDPRPVLRGATAETAVEDTAQRATSTCWAEAGSTGQGKGWVTFSAAGGSQGHGVEETVAREQTRKGLKYVEECAQRQVKESDYAVMRRSG